MPLTASRDTVALHQPTERVLPVAAGVKLYAGALVVLAGGFIRPARVAVGDVAVGRAEETVDNTTGADGAVSARVQRGVFRFANSGGGDALTLADIGASAYSIDDATVAKTSGTNTRSIVGRVYNVDSQGVWVEIA